MNGVRGPAFPIGARWCGPAYTAQSRTIVLVHNAYQQAGGEDEVFRSEAQLLMEQGHKVVRYSLDNRTIRDLGRLSVAGRTLWNHRVYRELQALFTREAPAVAHFHNTFPLVSPSAYYAARDAGIPVVQTLHNYRLLCPSACLFRRGQTCEDCLGKTVPWPAIVHGCYRRDRLATSVVAGMLTLHRFLRTWTNLVDVYVAVSDFARRKFIAGGLPERRIVVKPNFLVSDPGVGEHRGRYGLYVGRLSVEKGLDTLLDGWTRFHGRRGMALKIVGTGPLQTTATTPPGVEWLGWRSREQVYELMHDAEYLVLPSACYENFPMVIAEAFATGLPVIASGHGAMAEVVQDRVTGLHFQPRDAIDLASKLDWASANPGGLREMGSAARREFERKYTAPRSHAVLQDIYQRAIASRASARVKQ
jgi:glycosyltransferase involved in cell wall biosynthesis